MSSHSSLTRTRSSNGCSLSSDGTALRLRQGRKPPMRLEADNVGGAVAPHSGAASSPICKYAPSGMPSPTLFPVRVALLPLGTQEGTVSFHGRDDCAIGGAPRRACLPSPPFAVKAIAGSANVEDADDPREVAAVGSAN